jgi:hypothetical protein
VLDPEAPPSPSWWLLPDFQSHLRAFNEVRKVMGDSDLPPVVRDLLQDAEVVQHLAASAMPKPKQ